MCCDLYVMLVPVPLSQRWGTRAEVRPPRGLPRRTYSNATAVECLFGFLWMTDHARLREVLQWSRDALGEGGGAGRADGEVAGGEAGE